ncbi:MAG TPA: hypothetical protein VHB50_00260, partial [Bryobacteraceae bacterium]|nr:hypothetical protein [Bryobacteraceae bacterium]
MHEYDTALKSVLRKTGDTVLRDLTGFAIERWHSVELQDVRRRNVDLLGEAAGGQLIHIELQSRNDADMAIRMAEYALMIFRGFRRFPEQVVLYVGEPPLRMEDRIAGTRVSFACRMVDIRELDGERLLESPRLEDNVIAILAKLNDQRSAVRRILGRIA